MESNGVDSPRRKSQEETEKEREKKERSKVMKMIWFLAVSIFFALAVWQIYLCCDDYFQYNINTGIEKLHEKEIEFPSVTFCNFNRWRKSYLTDEVLNELNSVMAMYNYDYVIPEISDRLDEGLTFDFAKEFLGQQTNTTQKVDLTTTTSAPPLTVCLLPQQTPGLMILINGEQVNSSHVLAGATISFDCSDSEMVLMDGDITRECLTSGTFSGKTPLCIKTGDIVKRYTVMTNDADTAVLVAMDSLLSAEQHIKDMTLCFWIYVKPSHLLGTILSYGTGNETILSIKLMKEQRFPSMFGVKFEIFGKEVGSYTLIGYNQWNPFCLQYSSALSESQLYKYLHFEKSHGFQLYGDALADGAPLLSGRGKIVLFNDYTTYTEFVVSKEAPADSAGGYLANVNMWSRLLPIEVMNVMQWDGDLFSMSNSTLTSYYGNISTADYLFNVSVHQAKPVTVLRENIDALEALRSISRLKREAEATTEPITRNIGNSPPSLNHTKLPASNQEERVLKEVFNYAEFTRKAGWQLVDKHSGHNDTEPVTLLRCTYRGKPCNTKWFKHRFGAFGNCYTFNENITEELLQEEDVRIPLIQDSAGPIGGLSLLLDIQAWEYSESEELLGNPELGVKFVIHSPLDVPSINDMGYAASPGQKAFVGFEKSVTQYEVPPWGECDPDKRLKHFERYSYSGCVLECKLERVIKKCGCKPYYYPGDAEVCGFKELKDCGFIEIAKVNANISQCGCPIACTIHDYNIRLSYGAFPSDKYGLNLGESLNISLPKYKAGVNIYDSKLQYIKRNLVSIDLYFDTLAVTQITQTRACTITELLSNIGGEMGLFIGFSFLTIIEVLEFVVDGILNYKRSLFLKKRKYYMNGDPAADGASSGQKTLGHINDAYT